MTRKLQQYDFDEETARAMAADQVARKRKKRRATVQIARSKTTQLAFLDAAHQELEDRFDQVDEENDDEEAPSDENDVIEEDNENAEESKTRVALSKSMEKDDSNLRTVSVSPQNVALDSRIYPSYGKSQTMPT